MTEKVTTSKKLNVEEKLVTVQQALKNFDTRLEEINDQKTRIETDIHREIDSKRALLDQRRTELVRELEVLTQQKINALETQRDHVKMTDDLDPNTLSPETMADTKLVIKGDDCLHQACRGFLDIDYGEKFCLENSKTTGDGLSDAKPKETKTVYFEPMTRNNRKFKGQVDLKAEFKHTKSETKVKCGVVVEQNGRHKISYRPEYRGKHELHICVNEVPVQGSPFPITVTGLSEKPVTVIPGLNNSRGVVVNSKDQLVVVYNGVKILVLIAGRGVMRFTHLLNDPYGVTVDKDDNIYVVENGTNQIGKFSSEGVLLATAGSKGSGDLQFNYPYDICYNHGNNNLYVPDRSNHRIQVLTSDLTFVRYFGTEGSENGQFLYPTCAAFDSANNIYVSDYKNHRVQVFTADGRFLRVFSDKVNNQKLSSPWAIAIDSSDTVYVSENGPHYVSVFTSQGEYITTIGGQGSKEGQFNGIYGLSIDRNDSVIVSDCGNDRLQIFEQVTENKKRVVLNKN